jgi:hypothetical protein
MKCSECGRKIPPANVAVKKSLSSLKSRLMLIEPERAVQWRRAQSFATLMRSCARRAAGFQGATESALDEQRALVAETNGGGRPSRSKFRRAD